MRRTSIFVAMSRASGRRCIELKVSKWWVNFHASTIGAWHSVQFSAPRIFFGSAR
jgi:hypothetical protein